MAVILSDKLIGALDELVGDTKHVRRVVIDIQVNEPPIIHIERFGDERIIDVIRHLKGVEIRTTDRPREDGQP